MDRVIEFEYDNDITTNQCITIHQDDSIGIGGTIWDAALVMSYYIIKNYNNNIIQIANSNICCLSSGTGIEGIVLACCNSIVNCNIVITDIDKHVDLIRHNIQLNNEKHKQYNNTVTACEYYWGNDTTNLYRSTSGKFDYIFICDVLYIPQLYDKLIQSLLYMSDDNTIIYMCNEIRIQQEHPLYMDTFYNMLDCLFDRQRVDDSKLHSDYQCDTIELYECRLKPNE